MVTHLYQNFYRSNATRLSESDIMEIRDSREKIPNASKKMAEKFHIGACRVYEIWEHNERLQQGLDDWNDLSPPDPNEDLTLDKPHTKEILAKETSTKKISRKKKVSINKVEHDTKVSSHMVEKNISSIDNAQSAQTLSNISRRKADLEKLIKDTEKLAPMCPSLPQ
ncbi:hypothetical protein C2G38_2221524 [Gigaspora rosea]|uniref:Uncharacterized protein n=1 Tax=Gigaspora rosea TaxID=44941 RepID=A0A397UC87_9GLOM|nr:hypothetical protein C2G38_2221524 [Gigaspora rosea]